MFQGENGVLCELSSTLAGLSRNNSSDFEAYLRHRNGVYASSDSVLAYRLTIRVQPASLDVPDELKQALLDKNYQELGSDEARDRPKIAHTTFSFPKPELLAA